MAFSSEVAPVRVKKMPQNKKRSSAPEQIFRNAKPIRAGFAASLPKQWAL
jgi:hypothetical protein